MTAFTEVLSHFYNGCGKNGDKTAQFYRANRRCSIMLQKLDRRGSSLADECKSGEHAYRAGLMVICADLKDSGQHILNTVNMRNDEDLPELRGKVRKRI